VTGVNGGTPPKITIFDLKAPPSGDQPQTGWQYELGPGRMTSSVSLGPDGTIYAISGEGRLAALNADGSAKWTAQAGPAEHAAPALAGDGVVYAPSTDGNLYAIAPPASGNQGGVLWTFPFGDRAGIPVNPSATGGGGNGKGSSAAPTVGPDGTIYVGANNSNFYAVNPDGTLKWKYEAEPERAGIWSGAALSPDGRTVYFGANKGGIYAVDTASGKLVWQAPLFGGSVYASPTLDKNGTLYAGTTTGHVFALDSKSGSQLSVADTQGAVWTTPSIRPDGTLVAANRKGLVEVYAAA
jgi:outer membrane protein assembly factor BamB